MRVMLAAAMLAACMGAGLAASAPGDKPGAAFTEIEKQAPARKPPRQGAGSDSCPYAHDNECDEPGLGGGACALGADYSDCRFLREGEGDFCQWARDGECDEPNFGTGACVMGSDRTDCGDVADLRFRDDSCEFAFNAVCDEPRIGTGRCARRTDRRDCVSAQRPMTITDHFFGRDDRVFMETSAFPWSVVGELHLDTGEACTATLIGPDVLITAAHCINTDNGVNAQGRFDTAEGLAGGPYTARVTHYYLDHRYDYRLFNSGDAIDGLDWALLRIDHPLGARLGFVGVQDLTGGGAEIAARAELYQAGYSWDTENHLSGNIGCHIVQVNADNTFAHACDTTRGDSGSAFMVRAGEDYSVIGIDSNFRSNPDGPFIYIAVSAAGFAPYVADFTAGRIGLPARAAPATKPRAG